MEVITTSTIENLVDGVIVVSYIKRTYKDKKLTKEIYYNADFKLDSPFCDGEYKPAHIEYVYGSKYEYWYKDGKQHRDGGLPASILYHKNGLKRYESWYQNGHQHRDGDLPAQIEYYENGFKQYERWYFIDKLCRDNDKPNLIKYDDSGNIIEEQWFDSKHGTHRGGNKPAVIKYNSSGEIIETKYFINGREYDIDDPRKLLCYRIEYLKKDNLIKINKFIDSLKE